MHAIDISFYRRSSTINEHSPPLFNVFLVSGVFVMMMSLHGFSPSL